MGCTYIVWHVYQGGHDDNVLRTDDIHVACKERDRLNSLTTNGSDGYYIIVVESSKE